jgi:glycosyltransferase involved in cell wall biosynthesis
MTCKLIIVQWEYHFGGLEKISKLYEENFSALNPLVAVLRPTKTGFVYNNSYIFKTKNNLKFIIDYFLFVRKRRENTFHLQYTGAAILLLTFLAGAKKIIYHFHGTKFPSDSFTRLTWKFLQKKVVVIANSKFTREVVSEKLNLLSEITVLPNLIETKKNIYKARNYNGGKFIVTFVGRFDKGKNVGLIIESAKLIKNLDISISFLLVGDGPEKQNIEKQINENQLEDIIKVKPFTANVAEVYYKSNLLLFPSLYESFGNVVAEAVLTGLPVLCYKIPALEELISDEMFFFDTTDPGDVAQKLIYLKNNYHSANQRLLKVHDFLIEYLNEDRITSKLDNIYQGLNS